MTDLVTVYWGNALIINFQWHVRDSLLKVNPLSPRSRWHIATHYFRCGRCIRNPAPGRMRYAYTQIESYHEWVALVFLRASDFCTKNKTGSYFHCNLLTKTKSTSIWFLTKRKQIIIKFKSVKCVANLLFSSHFDCKKTIFNAFTRWKGIYSNLCFVCTLYNSIHTVY